MQTNECTNADRPTLLDNAYILYGLLFVSYYGMQVTTCSTAIESASEGNRLTWKRVIFSFCPLRYGILSHGCQKQNYYYKILIKVLTFCCYTFYSIMLKIL